MTKARDNANSGPSLIVSTTLTGASVIVSNIPQTYASLRIIIKNFKPSSGGQALYGRVNSLTGSSYLYNIGNINTSNSSFADTAFYTAANNDGTTATGLTSIAIPDYSNSATRKFVVCQTLGNVNGAAYNAIWSQTTTLIDTTAAITSLTFFAGSGNLNGGTLLIYGIN